jgi:dipeptidyl-peptidase 4
VNEDWASTVDLRAQKLCQAGYVVMRLDNRGSYRRGLKFESKIAKDMGNLEVEDQIHGVQTLVKDNLVDPKRVGIYGWSYGGYMSAMSLCRGAHVFKAAVAGAPVTSWFGYDTHYTERYMGLPKENPQGYKDSAVMSHVDKMKGKLLLIHGSIDENVHFHHTARLIHELNNAQKDYELLLFPNERHQPRGVKDRIYMEKRIFRFFWDALME